MLEAYTITGSGDLWCRVVSRSNADLQGVIDRVVGFAGVMRASTVMALATQVDYRVRPLARASATSETDLHGPDVALAARSVEEADL